MYLAKHAIHVFSLAVALLPFAEQETEKITKSSTPVVVSLEQVLENVYQQYSDKVFNSVDVRYVEIQEAFPYPVNTRYVINGEDRRRESSAGVEDADIAIWAYVNGRATSYYPGSKSFSIDLVKQRSQDICRYLLQLGIPLLDEQRANASNHFPETLRDPSLDWKLDSTYWLVDGHECFKITNKFAQEFYVDPKVGYSFRWNRLDPVMDNHFSDFRKVNNKWMPFQIEMSGHGSLLLTVESLEFGVSKSLEIIPAPGTMVTDTINNKLYFLDANGKRQELLGAIDEAKDLLPARGSVRWLTGGIIVVLVSLSVYWMRNQKKRT